MYNVAFRGELFMPLWGGMSSLDDSLNIHQVSIQKSAKELADYQKQRGVEINVAMV